MWMLDLIAHPSRPLCCLWIGGQGREELVQGASLLVLLIAISRLLPPETESREVEMDSVVMCVCVCVCVCERQRERETERERERGRHSLNV